MSSHKLLCRFLCNCYVIRQTQKTRGHVYITAPKHVCDDLVQLNGVKFKGKLVLKVKCKLTNRDAINFASPN